MKDSLIEIISENKTGKKTRNVFRNKATPLWIPSWSSFLKILFLVIITWFLTHPQYLHDFLAWLSIILHIHQPLLLIYNNLLDAVLFIKIPNLELQSNHYQNLIAIHAGIGAVLIGMAFFVAESLTNNDDPEKGRVLLFESHFFPLLTGEILVFCTFLWGDTNILSVIPVLVIALFTIYFLGRVINILVRDYEMDKAKKKMFIDLLKRGLAKMMDWEIKKRKGNNWLFNTHKDNGKFQLIPLSKMNDKYFSIKSIKTGYLVDIINLKKFIAEVETTPTKNKIDSGIDSSKTSSTDSKPNLYPLCYLGVMFYSKVNLGEDVIWLRKDMFEDMPEKEKRKKIAKLEKIGRNILVIKEIDNPEEEVKKEVAKIKDKCFAVIEKEQLDKFDELTDLYLALVQEFYDSMKSIGAKFSQSDAEKERGAFLEELKPTRWIIDDVREVFNKGVKSSQRKMVGGAAYLPMRLARQAVENGDHLFYQWSIEFPIFIYFHALEIKETSPELADFMFDRMSRYLVEFANYYLEPRLEDNEISEEDFKGYSFYIFKVFQTLLKSCIDKRDVKNFRGLLLALNKIFEQLGGTKMYRKMEKDKADGLEYLSVWRSQIFFGLGSWLLHLREDEGDEDAVLKELYDSVKTKITPNVEDLTKVFIKVHSFEVEDLWGWDSWELSEKGEGMVHTIQILDKLEKFYVINALLLLANKTEADIGSINLPPNRDLNFLAEGTGGINKILDDVKANPQKYDSFLNEQAIKNVELFRKLLDKAKSEQEKIDKTRLKSSSITPQKIDEFKEKVLSSFNENVRLRKILDYYNKFRNKISESSFDLRKNRFGVNTVDSKEPFMNDWYVHYIGWGENYGQNLAYSEDSLLLTKISEMCKEIKQADFTKEIDQLGERKDLILLITANSLLWNGELLPGTKLVPYYQSKKQLDVNGFVGWCQINEVEIPIFEVHYKSEKRISEVIIINKNTLCSLIQYSPLDSGESINNLKDIFYMNVQSFSESEQLMNKFLNEQQPKWLADVGDKNEQREHLKERVLIHIFERFKLEEVKNARGFKIILKAE